MIHPDQLVGSLAITLGVLCFCAGLLNLEWCFTLRKAQWVERRWGRAVARVVYGVLGVFLVLLGIGIAMGLRWQIAGESARFNLCMATGSSTCIGNGAIVKS